MFNMRIYPSCMRLDFVWSSPQQINFTHIRRSLQNLIHTQQVIDHNADQSVLGRRHTATVHLGKFCDKYG